MKIPLIFFSMAILSAACSSQRSVYYFDTFDYNSGRKTEAVVDDVKDHNVSLKISKEDLVASADKAAVLLANPEKELAISKVNEVARQYSTMSKTDQKALRKEIKKEVKQYVKSVRSESVAKDRTSTKATKAFDTTVSLAILFGGAGIVLIALAGISNIFWVLGAISLVIGAVFFVQWVSNGNG